MAIQSISYGWQTVTVTKNSVIKMVRGSVYFGPAGSTDLNAGEVLHTLPFVPAGGVLAFRGPGKIDVADYVDELVPAGFEPGDWSIVDSATALKADVTLVAIPSVGSFPITAIEWSADAGVTWTAMVRTTAGVEAITTGNGAKNVLLRVRSVQGVSWTSASKAVTVS